MSLIAKLEQTLYQYTTKPPKEELRLVGWRFAVNQHTTVKAGIRNNKLGEVYASPSLNQSYTGDLLLIWPGNLCSHAVINTAVVEDLSRLLPLWQQGAYMDPEGSVLLKPEPFPLVALEDHPVRKAVTEDPEPLFKLLSQYGQELPSRGIETIQAGASAGWGIRHIRTSEGLSLSYAQTSFNTYVAADGLFSKQFAKRRFPTLQEFTRLLETVGTTVQQLKRNAQLNPGKQQVIFAPGLVEEFTAKYLIANLSGNNVVNSQGAFSLKDFQQQKQVFDSRLSFSIDPLKPFELSSYLCTREGLPAARNRLVAEGKLLTPFLTVKDSCKSGLSPTSLPQGSGLFWEVGQTQDIQELIKSTDSGILVHGVLGLHTQDGTSGNYSLSAPNCLKVENGEVIGRVQAVISGNFLQHLADPETEYATQPGENFPALRITTNVVGT